MKRLTFLPLLLWAAMGCGSKIIDRLDCANYQLDSINQRLAEANTKIDDAKKTLAAKAPLGWARACALPLALFTLLVTPLRVIVQAVTNVLLRPLGDAARNRPARDLSEAEFRTLVDAGSAQGQVDARERRLIHRVFDGVSGVKKEGGAWVIPEEVDVSVFIGLPSEVMAVPRVSRAEATADLLTVETHKGERYYFAVETVVGVKCGPSEKRASGRGAGFR